MGEALALRHVQKRYGQVWAVHDTCIKIEAGEFVSIVGPSGSGKTSLLTMIAGFKAPTAGSIHVGDEDVTRVAPNHRNIGIVFQKYALFPHMTVRENVEFPLRMRHLAKGGAARQRVDTMLDLVQLQAFRDRYPHELSGGQQQRVAVARALVFDPPVILMDEPLGALDKKLRENMQIEIKQIQERIGATVIYVTHDQEEALTMSDRVAVMHGGRLEQIGTPRELYSRPASAFIADFVGTINFLDGHVEDVSGADLRVAIGRHLITLQPANLVSARYPSRGSPVRIGVRPEHLRVQSGREEGGGSLLATVETLIFAGASRTAIVHVAGLTEQYLRVALTGQDGPVPLRGDRLSLQVEPQSVLLYSQS
ncbi:ABC transporter ATP-binding protein (plasmid) [Peteryoungia desertarenae]|uniref:ABC transporter ATP-binding protein n=1 Tax=Peteryoungia desertarenae TaxID=1813451 RepID=A0ABX6QTI6_9HYPH|nr:ABC transporter ATP-binding protein [Peteryoungia desertarenae]QLF71727.1 ABC transporter ATP-binding protein [Peteryoungia desertarenae]